MFFDVYKSLCEGIGKTPNGVAKEIEFASSSVTQWKHGSTPRPDALQRIADYFGVSVGYLLTGEQKEKPAHDVDELSELKRRAHNLIDGIPEDELEKLMPAIERLLGK
uniref:HTH XrE protein n=1 Tax=Dulem virus 33 TaxID=3145751 RepID=A0AAU8B5K1_9CAUD